jgi:hypothetical protein
MVRYLNHGGVGRHVLPARRKREINENLVLEKFKGLHDAKIGGGR